MNLHLLRLEDFPFPSGECISVRADKRRHNRRNLVAVCLDASPIKVQSAARDPIRYVRGSNLKPNDRRVNGQFRNRLGYGAPIVG